MIDQLVLPGLRPGRYLTTAQRYAEWRGTPDGIDVYRFIRKRAIAMRNAGWRHYSMKALWEVARFELDLERGPESGFKLNNDYTALLARELMAELPALAGMFELRARRAA